MLEAPLCGRCGAPVAWPVARCGECSGRRLAFASARAAVAYDRTVAKLVAAWKEQGLRRISCFAAELVTEAVGPPRARALTFVPPDRERSLKRGHHPAARLARELGERWDREVKTLLARSGGQRQRGLPLRERRRNVRGAFWPVADAPTSVVLVDDVYTSGATAAAAASALRRAGARRVDVVTFARAVR
jgi:predicted amidophosphoribosyltransferase